MSSKNYILKKVIKSDYLLKLNIKFIFYRLLEHKSPQPLIAEALDSTSNIPSTTTLTVIVVKDERGYGMKVSGDNPVFVQSVKQSGAAEKAGLHSGDKIIRVNGVNVTHSTHTEVVELIKCKFIYNNIYLFMFNHFLYPI